MRFAGGHNCIQFFRPLKRAPAFGLDSSPQACAWGYLLAPAHAGTVYGLDCSAYDLDFSACLRTCSFMWFQPVVTPFLWSSEMRPKPEWQNLMSVSPSCSLSR